MGVSFKKWFFSRCFSWDVEQHLLATPAASPLLGAWSGPDCSSLHQPGLQMQPYQTHRTTPPASQEAEPQVFLAWSPGFGYPHWGSPYLECGGRALLRLLSCFRDTLKSRCTLSMQTVPCRGMQPFKRGNPQRSLLPDGIFASSAISEPQIIFAKFPKCLV